MFIQDFFRSAELNKVFGDFVQSRMGNAGRQFAIREGACTALAELYVGLRLEDALLPERFYVFDYAYQRLDRAQETIGRYPSRAKVEGG